MVTIGFKLKMYAIANFVLAASAMLLLVVFAVVQIDDWDVIRKTWQDSSGAAFSSASTVTLPFVAECAVCFAAGIGILRRRRWGYLCHLTGIILTAFTCFGMIYSLPAIYHAIRPEFRSAFGVLRKEKGNAGNSLAGEHRQPESPNNGGPAMPRSEEA